MSAEESAQEKRVSIVARPEHSGVANTNRIAIEKDISLKRHQNWRWNNLQKKKTPWKNIPYNQSVQTVQRLAQRKLSKQPWNKQERVDKSCKRITSDSTDLSQGKASKYGSNKIVEQNNRDNPDKEIFAEVFVSITNCSK